MSLTPEDLQAIAGLIDQRLTEADRIRRRRRRRWILILVVISVIWLVLATIAAFKASEKIQDYVVEQDRRVEEMRQSYAAELAKNRQWQEEREKVAKAVAFQPKQSQAEHEAGLVATAIRLMGKQKELSDKLQHLDGSDPEAMNSVFAEIGAVVGEGTDALTRVLLRNTDPGSPSRQTLARDRDGAMQAAPHSLQVAPQLPAPVPHPAR